MYIQQPKVTIQNMQAQIHLQYADRQCFCERIGQLQSMGYYILMFLKLNIYEAKGNARSMVSTLYLLQKR